MKLLKITINGLSRFASPLEIEFFARQRVVNDESNTLFQFAKGMYTNNIMSFIGLNASGKTSVLRVISFIFEFLNATPINNCSYKNVLDGAKDVSIDSYFSKDDAVYKLHSQIKTKSVGFSTEYEISNEYLLKKSSKCAKKDIYSFDNFISRKDRDKSSEYLKDDISIIISINKSKELKYVNLIGFTNINILTFSGDFPQEIVTFLDPSIESIRCLKDNGVKLKFYNKPEIVLQSPELLNNYLSSGTIKGISVFIGAMLAFQAGGYLIVDELENHFNKEIVATLLRFFNEKEINHIGATLVFSTHYPELLDVVDRMESVNIVRNNEGITVSKMNNEMSRSDLKKSEIYISNYLGGTAPSYSAYIELKKAVIHGKGLEKKHE